MIHGGGEGAGEGDPEEGDTAQVTRPPLPANGGEVTLLTVIFCACNTTSFFCWRGARPL